MRTHLASAAALSLCLALSAGCGNRVEVREDYDDFGPDGREEYTRSTTIRAEDDLERADRLVRESDYEGAISIFRSTYRHSGNDDLRARALYGWARTEGHLLNPERDVDEAIARLELLLEEFPDADVAFRASEELERLRNWRVQRAGDADS